MWGLHLMFSTILLLIVKKWEIHMCSLPLIMAILSCIACNSPRRQNMGRNLTETRYWRHVTGDRLQETSYRRQVTGDRLQ